MSENLVSQDEKVMASLSHLGVLLPFWGMIVAGIIWATQKDKSRLVAFHALQALAYQLSAILVGALLFACYFCSFGAAFVTMPFMGMGMEGEELNPLTFIPFILSMGLPFVVMALFILVWAVYVGYGLYGAIRVFQGRRFRYAAVGKWVERSLEEEA